MLALALPVLAQEDSPMDTGFIKKSVPVHQTEEHYTLYVPPTYTPDKSWPLIVFLHGAGERGNDNEAPRMQGIAEVIETSPEQLPALVLLPQCPAGEEWSTRHDQLEAQLETTRTEYNIDPKRIYLTGLSMGGYGTWLWGAIHTDTFAALVPICGGGDPEDIQELLGVPKSNPYGSLASRLRALATLPIWAFHGAEDTTVPPDRSRFMVEAIRARGGNIQYTEYEGVGHNSWDKAYAESGVISWMLAQRKAD
jgi:predicted peptidase